MTAEDLSGPPHDKDAERAYLGAILLSREPQHEALDLVDPEDFYLPHHELIYNAMRLVLDDGTALDPITLCAKLTQTGHLETCGGRFYILDLQNDALSTNAASYAKPIIETAAKRRYIEAATTLIAHAPTTDIDTLQTEAQRLLTPLERTRSSDSLAIADLAQQAAQWATDRMNTPGIAGLSTGLTPLDLITDGLMQQTLCILAARPSVGKSSLAENIAWHAARNGHHVHIVELEQSPIRVTARLAAQMARVNAQHIRQGTAPTEDVLRFLDAMQQLSTLPITIDPRSGTHINEIARAAQRELPRDGHSLIVVDHIGLASYSAPNPTQGLGEVSSRLKRLAKETDSTVLALHQLSRAVTKEERRPRLDDLRDSGHIEQDGDVVIFVHKRAGSASLGGIPLNSNYEIVVAKNRDGELGVIQVAFVPEWTRFFYHTRERTPAYGSAPL